jgi:hypothetical protein
MVSAAVRSPSGWTAHHRVDSLGHFARSAERVPMGSVT